MNKETFIAKINAALLERKIPNAKNFVLKGFAYPQDESDAEMTINGAQITVVLSEYAGIKYKFYKIESKFLKNETRDQLIKAIKSQYPGIIFFVCSGDESGPQTIDTENNLMVVDNDDFDAAVELCGNIDNFITTIL